MKTISYRTGRDYGKPQILIITAPDQVANNSMFEAHFVDTVRMITGWVELYDFELDCLGQSVLREYDAGRYTMTRRHPEPVAPAEPAPIVPDEIFKYWTPDEVAECMDVSKDTWMTLWRITGAQARPLHMEYPEELYPFALIHHWGDLTRDQQLECNRAAESVG
jgi:hypothetical protein